MKLYTYFRSSAAYRVRIALNLKGIAYDSVSVSLLDGQQKSEEYLSANPQGLVPALELDDGTVLSQSIAILEYLDECYPDAPLLPVKPLQKSRVRSVVNHIACDVHPLNNSSILHYLRDNFQADKNQLNNWYSQWVKRAFVSIEKVVSEGNGQVCFGTKPGMADCFLIPQVYNAMRFEVDLSPFPAIESIYRHCNTLLAFHLAHPDQQDDSPAHSRA
ncbi:MAG: maleylacetoacetate isomerase [Halioglobus sp.]|jgi:maleylacetoacetate isomerase